MILDRKAESIDENVFSRIAELFEPGDLLVLNDTRVLPARLFGEKESGGRVEVFLVRRMGRDAEVWSCLLRSSKKPRPGSFLKLPAGMKAQIQERVDDETWLVSFFPQDGFSQWLDEQGRMPLPPYIR